MDFFLALELAGVVFWVTYLILVVKENIWCWIFAIMASLITIVLFYHNKIYMEALLNVYYVGAACYGWYYWSKMKNKGIQTGETAKAPVKLWSWQLHVLTFLGTAATAVGLGYLMKTYTDSPRPFLDAPLAAFSFLATFMEARKVFTCWVYWFVVNVGLVILQIDREIYLYAGLSSFFVIMSVPGFIRWRRSYLAQKKVAQPKV